MSRQASGLKAWFIQRASAVYLALFGTYLLLHFSFNPPTDYAAMTAWAAAPLVNLGLLLFVPLLLIHSWVGIRDVLIDYVHAILPRVLLLSLFALMFLGSGLWALKGIIAASMGG